MNSFLLFGFSTCPSFLAEVRLFVFEKFLPVIFLFWTTGIRITSFCTTRFIFFSWFSTFCRSISRFSILILIAWCTFVTFAAESFTSLALIRTAFASFSAFFEVPEKEATNVIKALNKAKWNGRKVVIEIAGEESGKGRESSSASGQYVPIQCALLYCCSTVR